MCASLTNWGSTSGLEPFKVNAWTLGVVSLFAKKVSRWSLRQKKDFYLREGICEMSIFWPANVRQWEPCRGLPSSVPTSSHLIKSFATPDSEDSKKKDWKAKQYKLHELRIMEGGGGSENVLEPSNSHFRFLAAVARRPSLTIMRKFRGS